jgi:hypothetical protein
MSHAAIDFRARCFFRTCPQHAEVSRQATETNLERFGFLLLYSQLPFGASTIALLWLVLFVANHLVARRVRLWTDAQTLVVAEGKQQLRRAFQPRYFVLQIVFASGVFLAGFCIGSFAFPFFAGGLLVSVIYTLGLNIQGALAARSMLRGRGVEGALKFSTAFAYRQMAQRMTGGAIVCLLLGLVLPHLALLGGALLLGSTSAGYLRRARQADARASAPV